MIERQPDRYFIRAYPGPWAEVSKADFVRAERGAGFRNSLGKPDEPATAGFTSGALRGHLFYGQVETEQENLDRLDLWVRERRV